MAAGEPLLSRLDELRLQRELKEVLLEHVRAIYGPRNPQNHGFDITTHQYRPRKSARESVVVRAIVYTEPNYGKWKLLKQGNDTSYTITAAYQEFSKDLEREMTEACGHMSEGDVFDGSLRIGYYAEDLLEM
ncbi:hypothetical protein P280DRAFT_471594 [Massarina eburnea CBS 473.64]|uniref:Uncharacterized protein n=1 Tax=Massarina eburnea CBS 473.64 TaxID=1395130 RepID=A0A6A6RUI4_9PLEO|nr:hypothetical protein P280DRAFT_471594 [Massarina eburnea CBS 473.64]